MKPAPTTFEVKHKQLKAGRGSFLDKASDQAKNYLHQHGQGPPQR
ncbi:hypothetical protein ARUE_c43280 [Arthrobacter sp. Rue61a]|nr:hypothetical protein ARUE_c43280 [Arthrobacter sp. Rue61a]